MKLTLKKNRLRSYNKKQKLYAFDEAQSVFFDEYAQQFYDAEHYDEKDRYVKSFKPTE